MKRGSALLVVLGLVAFMIISAVAFSAYMRTSRLPSSFLVRTSSSRFLAKAALAEAIDQLDVALGNDLYPGMGDKGESYWYPRTTATDSSSLQTRRNYWRKNCFIGSNRFETAENTVSTLTLEGLAYLPPCMINEARYYSRHTRTARWQQLPFDSGRYAFSAYDVSNYFDINRVAANVGRNSSDNGRISIAYLFENANHDGYDMDPKKWEEFMNDFVEAEKSRDDDRAGWMMPSDSKMPLVSLADYALAAASQLGAANSQVPSPFCAYIEGLGNFNGDFVNAGVRVDDNGIVSGDGRRLRNEMFVTDSYLPQSPLEASVDPDVYDLNDAKYQPFTMSQLSQTGLGLRSPFFSTSLGATRLTKDGKDNCWLCGLGLAALWDYLDYDTEPLSLAIPTTERVPMICGLDVNATQAGKLKLTTTATDAVEPISGQNVTVVSYDDNQPPTSSLLRTVTQTTDYKLDGASFAQLFSGLNVGALEIFPFRRDSDTLNGDFTIGGRVALYFIKDTDDNDKTTKSLHTESDSDVLHLTVPEKQQFSLENGVFYMPLTEQSLSLPKTMETSKDAILTPTRFGKDSVNAASKAAQSLASTPMYTIKRKWQQTRSTIPGTSPLQYTSWEPADPTAASAGSTAVTIEDGTKCNITPLTKNGIVDTDYADARVFKKMVEGGSGKNVRLQMSVWLFVKDNSGNYVDLVPACIKDDDTLGNKQNVNALKTIVNQVGGKAYPLMNVYGTTFAYNPTALPKDSEWTGTGKNTGIPSSTVLYCPDPRWNWAPEHWLKVTDSTMVKADDWLANAHLGEDGRDRDVFMATSDMGYLQSVYELAFLPRLTDWPTSGEDRLVGCSDSKIGNMEHLNVSTEDFATSFNGLRNKDNMWRTYRPFDIDDDNLADAFNQIGFTSLGKGFRVNPYGPVDSLMAAFANTPYNWSVAATNSAGALNALGMSRNERAADNFNKKFTFSEHTDSDDSRFQWSDLHELAQKIYDGVHDLRPTEKVNGDEAAVDRIDMWKDVYDNLDWAGTAFGLGSPTFAGVTLSNESCDLTDADKRFLYGYWRDCFAPRQQLFLVFVRAEPTMLGGGSAKGTPPSLGARAVALVWRDPMPTIEDVNGQPRPHRTRILFYRQFE